MLFDFLWHFRGSVPVGSHVSDEQVIQSVANMLEQQDKRITYQQQNYIEFEAPLWEHILRQSWLALLMYDRGRFGIAEGSAGRSLRYELRSLHGFVWCLILSGIAAVFVGASEGSLSGLRIAAIAFAWLYGMNLLFAAIRVPSKIRRAVETA